MIRINLLPHREEKRRQRKAAFVRMLALSAAGGAAVVVGIAAIFAAQIADQTGRNNFIRAENTKLDAQIKEISTLKQEIEALKARQQAVQDLQSDRNQPVHLLAELVKQVPEGVYLRSVKQTGQRVAMAGYAQSNERVSELLRNLSSNSATLERPELIEIRAATIGQGKDARRAFEFTLNVGIKRPDGAAADEAPAGRGTSAQGQR